MNLTALQKISYGLYIISSKKAEKFNGQIANTVFQITAQPKTAPTYFKEESKKEVADMQKYKCTVCGYIYDPEQGDPDSGIKPKTPFENLPDTWVCPVCGADKSLFEKEG